MSTGAVIGLIVAIIVVAVVSFVVWQDRRRSRLRRQFGPEYARLAKQLGSNRKAESELLALQRKASKLSIQPLSPEQRAKYTADWTSVQERFVDSPAETVAAARRLIARVMRERGYPDAEGRDLIVNLSVHNPRALDDFRKAETTLNGRDGQTATEDLRVALLGYRTLFTDLTGAPHREGRQLTRLSGQRSSQMDARQVVPGQPAPSDQPRVPRQGAAR